MPWLLLSLAILSEVIGTIALKTSDGFSHLGASAVVVAAYVASFVLLGLCLKEIEIGVAYAIWAGVGTALIAVAGLFLFNETMTPLKLISITLIVGGVIGLNMANGTTSA